MRRLKQFAPKKAPPSRAPRAHTKKEAALRLVALEFGVERLEVQMEHMRRQLDAGTVELDRQSRLRHELVAKIRA